MAIPEFPKALTEVTAFLETVLDDQGGGFSQCSSCETKLDIRIPEVSELFIKTGRCPNPDCHKKLLPGKVYGLNFGGTDF
jgi:hypothetical protein